MSQEITINRPMVLIPLERYKKLLEESGEKITPKLSRQIAQAKKEFLERKTIKWEDFKGKINV